MARINTRIDLNRLIFMLGNEDLLSVKGIGDLLETNLVNLPRRPECTKVRKLIIIGGIVFLTCRLYRGLLRKALMLGAAKKL